MLFSLEFGLALVARLHTLIICSVVGRAFISHRRVEDYLALYMSTWLVNPLNRTGGGYDKCVTISIVMAQV